MEPLEAINSHPANVWLSSLYGFDPEQWGFLGFTTEWMRTNFVRDSRPGVLVVIFGGRKAPVSMRRKIIGIQQCSHEVGSAQEFMSPEAWIEKSENPETAEKWNFAVKVTRAWRVTPETYPLVSTFAPETYKPSLGLVLGSQGRPLSGVEALNILALDVEEASVYGEQPLVGAVPGPATEVLAPSKAGPVSQTSFVTRESEGPKHL